MTLRVPVAPQVSTVLRLTTQKIAGVAHATPAMVRTPSDLLRQREHRQRTAQLSVIAELLVAAHGTEAVGVLLEPRGHADAGPAADARKDPDVLLALMLVGEDVADDARRRLELEQFLVDVVRVDALEITLQCAVARDITRGHEQPPPDGE